MIALLLAAALTPPPMYGFFVEEVGRQAAAMGMNAPDVRIAYAPVQLEAESWAWVVPCDRPCHQALVIVKADVLRYLGYDGVRVLVRHELVHIRRQDHTDPLWLDESPAARDRTAERHREIELEVRKAFDKATLETAAVEIRWTDEMLRRKP